MNPKPMSSLFATEKSEKTAIMTYLLSAGMYSTPKNIMQPIMITTRLKSIGALNSYIFCANSTEYCLTSQFSIYNSKPKISVRTKHEHTSPLTGTSRRTEQLLHDLSELTVNVPFHRAFTDFLHIRPRTHVHDGVLHCTESLDNSSHHY